MKDSKNSQSDAATRRFRAEHARALPKKFTAAIAAGYTGMNVWALADIALLQQPRVTADWFFMGMIESQLGLGTFAPGAPHPAYYALKTTIEKLNGAASAEKPDVGSTVVAYRLSVRGNPAIVRWNEPGRVYFPGESEPYVSASLPWVGAIATITRVITEQEVSTPRVETARVADGRIALTLDATPVFVEAK